MTAVDPQVSAPPRTDGPTSLRDVLGAYVGLMKPRIIELLLLTTVPVMFLAQRGVPPLGLVVATVLGGTLSAGSANALNCVVRRRHRPADAPHPPPRRCRGTWSAPAAALVFGLALGVVSTLWLGLLVNWLSAGLALAANVFYVVGYTMILKRRTTQNIVWGGAAGCFPALIGWTAVTGELAWAPVVLFLVVFFWTPPHFWALAIRYREDYAAADVPMLPVKAGAKVVARQIVGVLLRHGRRPRCCCGRWPAPAGSTRSSPPCWALRSWSRRTCCCAARADTDDVVALKPMRLFHWSNMYLSLLFVAVALDPLLLR